jgi:hypothetical protein
LKLLRSGIEMREARIVQQGRGKKSLFFIFLYILTRPLSVIKLWGIIFEEIISVKIAVFCDISTMRFYLKNIKACGPGFLD